MPGQAFLGRREQQYDRFVGGLRRRRTELSVFALLALVTELTGRSLTGRLDRAFQVRPLAAPATSYYPFLLAGLRLAAALALAAVAWRLRPRAYDREPPARRSCARSASAATGGRRCGSCSQPGSGSPRFGATSLWFLIQSDLERLSEGRWPRPRAVAPHLRASGLRRPLRALRARLGRRPHLAARRRALRRRHLRARPQRAPRGRLGPAPRPPRARPCAAAPASASSSSRARLRSPPDPRRSLSRRGPVVATRVWKGERWKHSSKHTISAAYGYGSSRARAIGLLGPLTVVAGVIWAIVQPWRLTLLHPHHQGFWWLVGRAAAARRRRRHLLLRSRSRGRCSRTWRSTMEPHAEFVHWLFATGILVLGLILVAQAIVGQEVWAMRPLADLPVAGDRVRPRDPDVARDDLLHQLGDPHGRARQLGAGADGDGRGRARAREGEAAQPLVAARGADRDRGLRGRRSSPTSRTRGSSRARRSCTT